MKWEEQFKCPDCDKQVSIRNGKFNWDGKVYIYTCKCGYKYILNIKTKRRLQWKE